MTETTLYQPKRVFKMGSVRLEDPSPNLSPEEAIKLYAGSYPHLRTATLSEGHLEGEELVYEVIKPPATTKG